MKWDRLDKSRRVNDHLSVPERERNRMRTRLGTDRMKLGAAPTFFIYYQHSSLLSTEPCNVLRASYGVNTAAYYRMHAREKQVCGPLGEKRVNRSAPIANDAFDGPSTHPIRTRTYRFAV